MSVLDNTALLNSLLEQAEAMPDANMAELVSQVKAALPTLTITGVDADGVTHTCTVYGEAK